MRLPKGTKVKILQSELTLPVDVGIVVDVLKEGYGVQIEYDHTPTGVPNAEQTKRTEVVFASKVKRLN